MRQPMATHHEGTSSIFFLYSICVTWLNGDDWWWCVVWWWCTQSVTFFWCGRTSRVDTSNSHTSSLAPLHSAKQKPEWTPAAEHPRQHVETQASQRPLALVHTEQKGALHTLQLGNRTRAWHGRQQGLGGCGRASKEKEKGSQQQDKRRRSAAGNKGFLATIPGLGRHKQSLGNRTKGLSRGNTWQGRVSSGGLGKRGEGSAAGSWCRPAKYSFSLYKMSNRTATRAR